MISVLMYAADKRELAALGQHGREAAADLGDDDWSFLAYHERELLYRYLGNQPLVDISCVDVTADGGILLAEELRRARANMYMILLADFSVSPAAYIRPTIMAGSLLMRPLSAERIKRVFAEAASAYLERINRDDDEVLVIENRDGRQPVPYRAIAFFESREKKIYANTGVREYSFYDTLDSLEQRLPEGFIRCHRSFIVAKSRIKSVFISRGIIVLEDATELPLSRSYKSVFKELK